MAKRLTRTVFVEGVAYGPSSVLTKAVAAKITNPKAWADADESAPAPAGAGSTGAQTSSAADADVPVPDAEATVKELRDYAKAKGITLGAAKAKPEILAVLGLDADGQGTDGDQEPSGSEADQVPEADSAEDVDESTDPDADGDSAGADSE